jgi:hypothetical protein
MSRQLPHDGQRSKRIPARSGEAAEAFGTIVKLDGKIDSVVKEITRLHGEIEKARGEILAVFKLSLPKAIRIGELLYRVRASPGRKGKWLTWIAGHVPFSQRTAYNYINLYEKRDSLQHLQTPSLNNAYKALLPPRTRSRAEPESAIVTDSSATESDGSADRSTEAEIAPAPKTAQPQRRHKSQRQIMRELQKIADQECEAEIKTNDQLSAMIEKLSSKVRAAWLELPSRLAMHGKSLVELAERLRLNTPEH